MTATSAYTHREIRYLLLFFIFSAIYCALIASAKYYLDFSYSEESLILFAIPFIISAYRHGKWTFYTIAFSSYIICLTFIAISTKFHIESIFVFNMFYVTLISSSYFLNRAIIQRHLFENALQSERDKLYSILSNSPDRIAVMDKDYNVVFTTQNLEEIYNGCVGRKCYELFHKKGTPCNTDCSVSEVIHNRKENFYFTRTYDSFGSTNGNGKKIYEFHAYPIVLDGKECVVEYARDISARTQAEEELRKSQKKLIEREKIYRDAIELAGGVPYYLNYEKDNYDFVGSGIKKILGYEANEFTRRDWEQCERECYVLESMRGMPAKEAVREAKAGNEINWHAHYKVKTKTGEERWLSDSAVQIRNESGDVIGSIGFLQDITQTILQEKDRILLETAIEQAAESIVITDKEGKIIYVNPYYEKITGYTREETIGHNPSIIKSGKHKLDFYERMWSVLKSGKVWTGLITNKNKSGELFEEEAAISPIIDSFGAITNYVAVKRDVTERKQLEQRLLQSQKMEAIGSLAGGIAHDFNNILMATMGYAELVRSQLPPDGELYNQQTQIIQASIRAKELINQILSFSRRTEQEKQNIYIATIVKETLKLLSASIPKNIEIRCNIDAEDTCIFGDPSCIHQVVMNLCTNAYHAMRENGGVMTVSLFCKPAKTISPQPLVTLEDNDYCMLTVTDTGTGMNEKTLERAFEPYFSTKKKGDGTGLGLSVVHGIIQDHHGFIDIQSELGKGTTVTAALPVLSVKVKQIQQTDHQLPNGNGERILVIDDEWPIVEMLKVTLRQLGYKPDGFVSCRDAIDVFSKEPEAYDLVMTDLSMPHLSGIDVAKTILGIRSTVPIILCTGFVDQEHEAMLESLNIADVLIKPVLKKDVAESIHRQLHKPTLH